MNKLLITGGQLRPTVFKKLEKWQSTDRACVLEIDPASQQRRVCAEYISPKAPRPDELPAKLFKSASIRGNLFYTCTSTEVLIYELPAYSLKHYISIPCCRWTRNVSGSALPRYVRRSLWRTYRGSKVRRVGHRTSHFTICSVIRASRRLNPSRTELELCSAFCQYRNKLMNSDSSPC
jgi:hypothetical protein